MAAGPTTVEHPPAHLQWQLTQPSPGQWQLRPVAPYGPVSTRQLAHVARTLTQHGAIITAMQLGLSPAEANLPATIAFRLRSKLDTTPQLMAVINK